MTEERTLRDELFIVEDNARAQGYLKAADWIGRRLNPKPRRHARRTPPPKTPNLDRQPREHDYFVNLRTGGGTYVLSDPEDGYVDVLNMTRRSRVKVNRLLDSRLYRFEGSVRGSTP